MARSAFSALALVALTGCGASVAADGGSPADAGDARSDATHEVGDDAPLPSFDVATDEALDAASDAATPDEALDVATDMARDSALDAPLDVAREAAADAPTSLPEAGRDAAMEAGRDAGPDASAPLSGLDERPRNPRCVAWPRPVGAVQLTRVFPRLTFARPLALLQSPGDRSRFFVVEKAGVVRVVSNAENPSASTVFVDISSRVNSSPNEAGLLGMAFHPRFATNRQVFLSYTATVGGRLTSRLSRFVSMDGGRTLAPSSETVLLEIPQPYENHNGGDIKFGPDGFLYFAMGDGGSGGDPMGYGQRLDTLLGKILRIDVDGPAPYGVPTDNPFRTRAGARPEIYAYGLRNPWRMSFDRATGELWTGDVGQGALEEVDIITRGANYGWNRMEGTQCYPASAMCDRTGLVLPVHAYPRSEGVSITGGYVYRGRLLPSLVGSYVFGDFGSGRVWSLTRGAMGAYTRADLATGAGQISSFAEDEDGELYVLNYANGQILKLAPGAAAMDATPTTLSATGCVDMANPWMPAPGVIPYDLNAPLWSDGAEKHRFLAVPDGQRITVGPDGDWDLPVGSVLVKSFRQGTQRLETRLLVRHADGDWAGYTYAWNEAGTEATLLRGGATRTVGSVRWTYPSEAQCLQCHTTAAGRSLGLETAQLNRTILYPQTGRTANQLETLRAIGLFAAPLPAASTLPALPTYAGSAPLQDRARSYLHANCASCHQPGSTGRGDLDLRYQTPFARQNLCNAVPVNPLGLTDPRVLAPGVPARSLLHVRTVREPGNGRMPPLGTVVVDAEGAGLLEAWITGLTACP